ncbi:MAG: hypothetical protein AB4041_06670 [Microcystaceae cyanobacterium]
MKCLSSILTLTTLSLFSFPSSLSAIVKPNYYFPQHQSCAVYQGGIDSEKVFTFWVENKRQFTVKMDDSLNIAVALGNKIVAPYNVASLPNNKEAEFTYRTSMTGDHTIFIRGISAHANITICLN